jgi:hypothetical protein
MLETEVSGGEFFIKLIPITYIFNKVSPKALCLGVDFQYIEYKCKDALQWNH